MAWNDLTDEEKKKRLYVLNNNLLLQYRQNANPVSGDSGGQSSPVDPYITQYRELLTWADANGASPPSTDILKLQEDRLIRNLIYEGAFAVADQIFLLATKGGDSFSLINVKSPGTRNGVAVGGPTRTSGVGWSSGGSTTKYINTQFKPSVHGVNYTLNNAGVFFYTPTSEAASGSKVEFGSSDAGLANAIVVSLLAGAGGANIRINGVTASNHANPSTDGSYVFQRTASNSVSMYKNGILAATAVVSSQGLTDDEIYILLYNNNGSPSLSTTKVAGGFWMIGPSFAGMEFNLSAYNTDYLSTPEIITTPSFPDLSLSSFLTSIGNLSASFATPPTINQMILKGVSLVGANKWNGCALAENDCIYHSPGSAQTILKVDTTTDTYSLISTPMSSDAEKYGGACYVPSGLNNGHGRVYFAPMSGNSFCYIETIDDSLHFFDTTGPVASDSVGNLTGLRQWYGINRCANGKIYAMSYQATECAEIDPATNAIRFFDTTGIVSFGAGNLGSIGKWDGCLSYGDYVYGAASDATDFCKIDSTFPKVIRFGSAAVGTAKFAISSIGGNGMIYMFPYHDTAIKKLNPADDSITTLAATIGSDTTSTKVSSANLMADGNILVSTVGDGSVNTSFILKVSDDSLTAVGRNLSTVITTPRSIGGCVARNGAMYSTPLTGQFVLKQWYTGKTISLPWNMVGSPYGKYS